MNEHDETAGWYEWAEEPPAGRARLWYLKNGRGVWRTADLEAGSTGRARTRLIRTRSGDRLEVRNEGPDVVMIDGISKRTEKYGGEPWEIRDQKPCGSVRRNHGEIWTCHDEHIYAILRTDCFTMERPEYLKSVRGKDARKAGKAGEALIKTLVKTAGGEATRKRGNGEPDYDVDIRGRKTIWEVKTITKENWFKGDGVYERQADDRTLNRTIERAAKQLTKDSLDGRPTVLALVNFRPNDPHALTGDEIAQALFGDMVIERKNGEARTTRRRGRKRTRHLENISAIATLTVTDLVPKNPERGIRGSRLARNGWVLCATKIYANPLGRVPAVREDFMQLPAGWNTRQRGPGRVANLITHEMIQDWDGFIRQGMREGGPAAQLAGMMVSMRETGHRKSEEAREDALNELEDSGLAGNEVLADRRTFSIESTPAESKGEWVRYVYERSEGDRTARIAGCRKSVGEVLEMILAGGKIEEVAKTAEIRLGGKRLKDKLAGVRIAAAWAADLTSEEGNRPAEGDGVQLTPNVCSGGPRLAGTRVRVRGILDSLTWGMEPEKIAKEMNVEKKKILDGIRYGLRAVRRIEKRREVRMK